MDLQLEDFCSKPVTETKIWFKNWWYSLYCKHRPKVYAFYAFVIPHSNVAIKRVLDVRIWEPTFDAIKSDFLTKWKMMDFKWIVKSGAFLCKKLDHIGKCVVSYVEVTWNAENFDKAC